MPPPLHVPAKYTRMNRWILEMHKYNFDIQYQKVEDNYVADHLSRPVRIIGRSPKATWLELNDQKFRDKQ